MKDRNSRAAEALFHQEGNPARAIQIARTMGAEAALSVAKDSDLCPFARTAPKLRAEWKYMYERVRDDARPKRR